MDDYPHMDLLSAGMPFPDIEVGPTLRVALAHAVVIAETSIVRLDDVDRYDTRVLLTDMLDDDNPLREASIVSSDYHERVRARDRHDAEPHQTHKRSWWRVRRWVIVMWSIEDRGAATQMHGRYWRKKTAQRAADQLHKFATNIGLDRNFLVVPE